MKLMIAFTMIFLSLAQAGATCVVSPNATLNTTVGQSLPFSWASKSNLVRVFQDIGYTPGEVKYSTTLVEGDKFTDLRFFCGAERKWRGVNYICSAALILSQKQGDRYVTLSKTSTGAFDGASMELAIHAAAVSAASRTIRCEESK